MLSAKDAGVNLMNVVSFALSVVLYTPQVVPSVDFSQVPVHKVVVSTNNQPDTASYSLTLSVGTTEPNAVANFQANILVALLDRSADGR
jgi:hypothetical protein